jgi:endonuclease/exonuclease/phosphatase family metal-dependent hydrolase
MPVSERRGQLDRRRLLGSIAGLGLAMGTGTATAGETPTLSVMTRNLYYGVNLLELQAVESEAELRRFAGELLTTAEHHPYDARVAAFVAEIASEQPDVIALQEVVRGRKRQKTDSTDGTADDDRTSEGTGEWTTVVDLLENLNSTLAAEGLEYAVAASTVTTDAELVAETDDGVFDLAVEDRNVVLVRERVETGDARAGTYTAGLRYSLPDVDREIRLQRGYCLVDVILAGRRVTVATTHLERVSRIIRRLQAEELLGLLPSDGPVVVAGDLNSGPGGPSATYDRLTSQFEDAWADRPDAHGFTCCQQSSLRNEETGLDRRIDAVLYDGPLERTRVVRVGGDAGDRVEVDRDGQTVAFWPSNHAGVVARFEAAWSAPTPTPTPTPMPTSTSTPTPTRSPTATRTPTPTRTAALADEERESVRSADENDRTESQAAAPGFGVMVGLISAVLGALGLRSRE